MRSFDGMQFRRPPQTAGAYGFASARRLLAMLSAPRSRVTVGTKVHKR